MDDVSQAILNAWAKIWPQLKADPHQLLRRLQRRQSASLQRPLRHYCIALRASDRRITPAHWVIFPQHAMDLTHPAHPYEPIEHEVTIQTYALQKFCRPVRFDPMGEEVPDLIKQLGCSKSGLATARRSLETRRVPGLAGKHCKPIPIIHNPRPLDPGSSSAFAPPDQILGSLWQYLPDSLPDNFQQTIIRTPHFRNMRSHQRHAPAPQDHQFKDDYQLMGYRWICPGCKKKVRTIYYPTRVWNLCDFLAFDPALTEYARNSPSVCHGRHRKRNPRPPPTKTSPPPHQQLRTSSTPLHPSPAKTATTSSTSPTPPPAAGTSLISHLTAGLLYGHEVPPPPWYTPGQNRKIHRTRHLNARPPHQAPSHPPPSPQRLVQPHQIAHDLLISKSAVAQHIGILCRQENVPNRHALFAKRPCPQ
jgi:hypothetical protein